jgi:hypothetical protein
MASSSKLFIHMTVLWLLDYWVFPHFSQFWSSMYKNAGLEYFHAGALFG